MSLESGPDTNRSWSALPTVPLGSSRLGSAFAEHGCQHFQDAAKLLQDLPYGRISSPYDYRLVLTEGRGTCSSKHVLAAMLASELRIPVQLMLACFEMNEANTPGVGKVLRGAALPSILEAHCFLRFEEQNIDLTWPSEDKPSSKEYLFETTMEPQQIQTHKTTIHQSKLSVWAANMGLPHSAQELWQIRERCIAALQSAAT